jgi:hypothetical protein
MAHHRSNSFSCGNAGTTSGWQRDRKVDGRNRTASDYWRPCAEYSFEFRKSGGRYWDRLVDMVDLHIHIDEIPTWFKYYTIG